MSRIEAYIERIVTQKYSLLERLAVASILTVCLVGGFILSALVSVSIHYLIGDRWYLDFIVMIPTIVMLFAYLPALFLTLSSGRANGAVLNPSKAVFRWLRRKS